MNDYEYDIFFKTNHLSVDEKKELLTEAFNKSFRWWADILDCSKSWGRKKIDIPFRDILSKLDEECHFVFIYRRGFKTEKGDPLDLGEYALETGFSTMTGISYFLWINCKKEEIPYFMKKYKLTRMKY